MKTFCKYLYTGIFLSSCVSTSEAKVKSKNTDSYAPVVQKVTPELLRGKIAFRRQGDFWTAPLRLISPDGKNRATLPESFASRRPFYAGGFDITADNRFTIRASSRASLQFVTGRAKKNPTSLGVYTLDGKRIRQISTGQWDAIPNAKISPDGQHVAYTAALFYPWQRGAGYFSYQVSIARFDGKEDKKLDHLVIKQDDLDWPEKKFVAWGRDSQTLLCEPLRKVDAGASDTGDLFVTDINGSFVKKYDGDWSQFCLPEVSPDGKQRVVSKTETTDANGAGLYLENRRGELHQLKAGRFTDAQWSSDGKWISFLLITSPESTNTARNSTFHADLCVIQPDGHNFRILLRNLPPIDYFWLPS